MMSALVDDCIYVPCNHLTSHFVSGVSEVPRKTKVSEPHGRTTIPTEDVFGFKYNSRQDVKRAKEEEEQKSKDEDEKKQRSDATGLQVMTSGSIIVCPN